MDTGNCLLVQWSGLCASTAEGPGSISGRGTSILQTAWCRKRKKKRIQRTNEQEDVTQGLSKEAAEETGDGRWRG